jgi:Tol biopolymer transport system component/DNA-binding winged helix-turn-helix (wHTH) protein
VPEAAFRDRAPFQLGEIEVRPNSNELVIAREVVRIKPRLMDVLLRLAASPGQVVTREALIADAWPRRMVNDEVLSRAIADLRSVLNDDPREARYIETLPKVGYRLVAPIGAPAPMAARPARKPQRLIAALAIVLALAAIAVGGFMSQRDVSTADGVAALTRQLAGAEPFSSGVELEVLPRFSPDGRRVAFAAVDENAAHIVVREVHSAQRVVIGDDGEVNNAPVFFPDGQRLAFYRRAPGGECEIVAVDLGTKVRERLIDCARSPQARFDLSPDGRTLVYAGTVRPQFPAGLVARDLATGKERVLTSPAPDQGNDVFPRFSPDGATIAFLRGTQSSREVWTVALAEGAQAIHTGSPRGTSYGLAWLGARGPLLVSSDWFGQRALNRFDLATSAGAMVGARGARSVDVDRAGNLVFENAVYAANLFLLDPADPAVKPRELWPSTRYTNQPEFSPDGGRVLFVSNREGAAAIYVATLDGTPRRILGADEYAYMRPHWSRDGRFVYAVRVTRREDGERTQQAVRANADTGSVEVLPAFGTHVYDVHQAADGTLIVGEVTGNAARLMRASAVDATPERLPWPVASEYQVAGDRIAFMQPNLSGLTLCELATLRCEPLAAAVDEGNRFDWYLTRDAVWYRTPVPEVVRYDLARRAITSRLSFAPTAFGLSLAVSGDGRKLLVAREAPPLIDLMYAPVSDSR